MQNQGQLGTCWTFAGMQAIESDLLKEGLLPVSSALPQPVISSWHMAVANGSPEWLEWNNSIGEYALNASNNGYGWGGNMFFTIGYLARGSGTWLIPNALPGQTTTEMGGGPVMIQTQPKNSFPLQATLSHLNLGAFVPAANQPMAYLATGIIDLDYNTLAASATANGQKWTQQNQVAAVKNAIQKYGAVYTDVYAPGNPIDPEEPDWDEDYLAKDGWYHYYYKGSNAPNHAVAIVGWNDALTFNGAPGPGGYIVQNSWGTGWGINGQGLFYASYYDVNVGRSEATAYQFSPMGRFSGVVLQNQYGPTSQTGTTQSMGLNWLGGSAATQTAVSVLSSGNVSSYLGGIGIIGRYTNQQISISLYTGMSAGGPVGLLPNESITEKLSSPGYFVFDLNPTLLSAQHGIVVEVQYDNSPLGGFDASIPAESYANIGGAAPGLSYYWNGNQWIDLASDGDSDIFFLKGFLLQGLNTYTGALLANSYYNYSTGEEVQYIPTTGDFYVNGYAFTSGDNVTIHNLEFAGSSILQVNNQLTVNGEFTVDSGTSEIYGGSVTVPGNFYMTGSGTLVANTNFNVGGQATINEGTLELLGQMIVGGNVLDVEQEGTLWLNSATVVANVDNVGTIMGTGTIAGNVNNNGVVMPGDAPGTLAVKGSYTQGPSGTLGIGVAGIDGSQYSRVLVGGNASVNGTLSVFSLNNFRPVDGNSFEVLRTNGSRSGEFARVNDFLNYNPNLQQIDIYAPNGVALLYVAATTPPPLPTPTAPTSSPAPSPTPNPRPPIIDVVPKPLPPVEPNEPLPPSFVFPVLDPTAEQLTAMYEIGFSEANTQRFNLDERFDAIQSGSTGFVSNLPPAPPPVIATTTGKEIAPKQPVLPPSPPEYRWGVWANGWGDWVSVSNDGSAKGYDFTTGGFIIGVDYRITDHFAVGVMGSYGHTDTNLQPSGDIDVNNGGGGIYLTYFCNGFYVDAATYGGYNSYSTSGQGLLGMANGSTSSGEFSTWTGAGYNFHFGDFTVGPMAALQYTLVHLNGFNETGSLLPLHIQSDHQGSLRTDLGGRASYTCHLGSVLVIPTLTVAWEHEYFYSDLPITVNSVDFPGQSATFFGPAEGHDSAIINAGVAFQFTPRLSTYLGYQGQLGRDHYNSNAITGGFSLSF